MNEPRKTCCLYLRVSTAEQTCDNQRGDVVQLARARGFEIVEVYEEKVSAASSRRAFDTMMLDAHRGRFGTIVVWSLDRFGRSMSGNLAAVIELDRMGVEVESVRESWLSSSGPARSLMLAVVSWVAEQERRRISERTKAALDRLRAKGVHVGRPRARVDMAEALRLRADGHSIRSIARKLKVGASTLHRALAAHVVPKAGCPAGDPQGAEITSAA